MEFYIKMLLFIGVMSIVVPFVLFFANTVSHPFLLVMQESNSVYYQSANSVAAVGNNSLIYVFPVIVLIAMMVGVVGDIWGSIKYPKMVAGIANLLGIFVLVGIWLVLNNFISNSMILAAFDQPSFPLYQIFASNYLITSLCAAMLISASFHLSGHPDKARQP